MQIKLLTQANERNLHTNRKKTFTTIVHTKNNKRLAKNHRKYVCKLVQVKNTKE